MRIKPEALSPDGYIIDQRQTDNINFGHTSSDRNGCGWIACYNFLKALDSAPDPEALCTSWNGRFSAMERWAFICFP